MDQYRWLLYALLGAFFAGLVSVLTKRSLDKTDFLVALSVQVTAMFATLLLLTTAFGRWAKLGDTPRWALGLVAVAGVAAGASWFFGYRALQLSSVSQSTPIDRLSLPVAVVLSLIFLKETPTAMNWVGIGLMLTGAFFVASGAK
jgi:bacterial/archaeal transporter family protein